MIPSAEMFRPQVSSVSCVSKDLIVKCLCLCSSLCEQRDLRSVGRGLSRRRRAAKRRRRRRRRPRRREVLPRTHTYVSCRCCALACLFVCVCVCASACACACERDSRVFCRVDFAQKRDRRDGQAAHGASHDASHGASSSHGHGAAHGHGHGSASSHAHGGATHESTKMGSEDTSTYYDLHPPHIGSVHKTLQRILGTLFFSHLLWRLREDWRWKFVRSFAGVCFSRVARSRALAAMTTTGRANFDTPLAWMKTRTNFS